MNKLKLTEKKKIFGYIVIISITIFVFLVSFFIGIPLLKFANQPEKFRSTILSYGIYGRFAYIGIMLFQVIFAFIPGEPFELLAGYTFGALEGTFLCSLSSVLGSSIVFFLVRKFRIKFVNLFFSLERINSLKILHDKTKFYFITFILFFIPGTPKDLLSYVAGLTEIKFIPFIIISTIAKIPSIVTSTVSGDALGDKKYIFAIIVFSLTALSCIFGLTIYNKITKK